MKYLFPEKQKFWKFAWIFLFLVNASSFLNASDEKFTDILALSPYAMGDLPPSVHSEAYSPFEKGRYFTQIYSGSDITNLDPEDMSFSTLGYGYNITDRFAVLLNFNFYEFVINRNPFQGIGFAVPFRWYYFKSENWNLFADAGYGLFMASHKIPTIASAFNFIVQGGMGMTYKLDRTHHLVMGTRFSHLSNGGMTDPNPGVDSFVTYFGLLTAQG